METIQINNNDKGSSPSQPNEENQETYDIHYLTEEAHRAQSYFVNYAHLWGLVPFTFNLKNSTVYHDQSKAFVIRWYLTISLCCLVRAWILVQFALDLHNGEMKLNSYTITRVLFVTFYMAGGGLHLHTVWKRYEIPALMNNTHVYYMLYLDLYAKDLGKELQNNLCGMVMKGFFFLMTMACLGLAGLFVSNCEFHFLTSAMPICDSEVLADGTLLWRHKSLPVIIFFTVVQFCMATELLGSTFVYIGFSMPAVYVGVDMLRELMPAHEKSKMTEQIQEHRNWFTHYRCCQIMTIHVNDCISEFLMPVQVCGCMGLCVLTSFVLLTVDGSYALTACCLLIDFILLGFTFVTLTQASMFEEVSKEVLQERKKVCTTDVNRKTLRSLLPVTSTVGSYRRLDKTVFPDVFSAIVDYTISAVLSF